MSRPRVLCVSRDRSTRASITLSLTDEPVNVVVAQRWTEAISRLEREEIDAVVVDASTIANVSTIIDAAESEPPATPTFVCWGDPRNPADESAAVLDDVVTRADDAASADGLANTVVDQLDAVLTTGQPIETAAVSGRDAAMGAETEPAPDRSAVPAGDANGTPSGTDTDRSSPPVTSAIQADCDRIVDAVSRQLVDATSPAAVERVLREVFTASDRFAFAWVGEYDRGEGEIVPWLTDPSATEWPMQRTFSVCTDRDSLLARALCERDLQIVDPSAGRDAVPFGEQAVDRGVRSVAAVPLATTDERYGVLVVYALTEFSAADRDTLRSVGDITSHVLETIAIRGQLDQQERILHRYERLVETAGDGMYVFDEDGNFMTVNDALVEMTGYSREGLLGEHATFLFDEDDVEAGEEIIRSLLESAESTDTAELGLETKDGETIPCEIQIAILTRGGEFDGSVGVVRDITERKRQERKLRERNERLDAFARIVSHDLRNPLGVAQGYLDLIDKTGSTDHVENVRDGLDRMEAIIDDVLAIARSGEWATETESVDLESVAIDAWDHVSTAEASLEISATTPLQADRSRLLRLLENCFRNSIEHGGSDVTVRIGTLENGSGFFVADDGKGLPDEIRDDVFDPSVSSSSEGLGIGLWVVREVATGHGWSVGAAESERGGARFEFEVDGQFSD